MSNTVVRIAGAGALGLFVALALVRRGVAVEVWDPGPPLRSASAVAAGMLAPVTEAVLDLPDGPDVEGLLFTGQAHWLDEAVGLNLPLERCGALLPALSGGEAELLSGRFGAVDRARLLGGREARSMQPWLGENVEAAVFVPQDWRVDARSALAALRSAVDEGGAVFRRERLASSALAGGPVVIAAGYAARAFPLPELGLLTPIKGQIARLAGGPEEGPTVRTRDGYIVPRVGGAMVGATMEEGVENAAVDALAIADLLASAREVMPGLEDVPARGLAGVRASTPDGLPMVGPSSREGVFLATGARRNGWLLAPLVGRMVAAYLTGDDPGPYAARLDPRRFDR